MSTETLVVEKREATGRQVSSRLRREGQVPAVLYGRKQDVVHLTVSQEDLMRVLRQDTQIVELQVGEDREAAQIKEVQYDSLGDALLHVDFTRISLTEEVEVSVSITTRGTSPGMEAGGVLDQTMRELQVKCLPANVPTSIVVDVSGLEMDAILRIADLVLPDGVRTEEDPEQVVLHIAQPREEEEEEEEVAEVAVEGAPAEPEVIGRTREPEEGEEEQG